MKSATLQWRQLALLAQRAVGESARSRI